MTGGSSCGRGVGAVDRVLIDGCGIRLHNRRRVGGAFVLLKIGCEKFGLVGWALMGFAEVLGNLGCVGWSARSVGAMGALDWIR